MLMKTENRNMEREVSWLLARIKTKLTKTIIKTSLGCEDILGGIVALASVSVKIQKTKPTIIIVRTNNMKTM